MYRTYLLDSDGREGRITGGNLTLDEAKQKLQDYSHHPDAQFCGHAVEDETGRRLSVEEIYADELMGL